MEPKLHQKMEISTSQIWPELSRLRGRVRDKKGGEEWREMWASKNVDAIPSLQNDEH